MKNKKKSQKNAGQPTVWKIATKKQQIGKPKEQIRFGSFVCFNTYENMIKTSSKLGDPKEK